MFAIPPYADPDLSQVPSPCMFPTGHRNPGRYAQRVVHGRPIDAHRLVWILHRGAIPPGKIVRHDCDTPGCINVNHLRLGTKKDNSQDMARRNRGGWVTHPERVPRGSRNGRSKLTAGRVRAARGLVRTGAQQKRLAAAFGVSPGALNKAILGRTWAWLQ